MSKNGLRLRSSTSLSKLFEASSFTGLSFYLFLPSFDTRYRKELAIRINRFNGTVSLAASEDTSFIVFSNNLAELAKTAISQQ